MNEASFLFEQHMAYLENLPNLRPQLLKLLNLPLKSHSLRFCCLFEYIVSCSCKICPYLSLCFSEFLLFSCDFFSEECSLFLEKRNHLWEFFMNHVLVISIGGSRKYEPSKSSFMYETTCQFPYFLRFLQKLRHISLYCKEWIIQRREGVVGFDVVEKHFEFISFWIVPFTDSLINKKKYTHGSKNRNRKPNNHSNQDKSFRRFCHTSMEYKHKTKHGQKKKERNRQQKCNTSYYNECGIWKYPKCPMKLPC